MDKLHVMDGIEYAHLFADGTKIEANANEYSFVWKKSANRYEARLDAKAEAIPPVSCRKLLCAPLLISHLCLLKLPLPREDRSTNAIRDKAAIALRIAVQRSFQLKANLFCRELRDVKLLSVQVPRMDHLAVEGRVEWSCFRRAYQRGGIDVHRRRLYIGQKPGAVIKDRAVIKFLIPLTSRC